MSHVFQVIFAATLLSLSGISYAQCGDPVPMLCDADGDFDVDVDDISAIADAKGSPAQSPLDFRDIDGDGVITLLDARQCVVSFDVLVPADSRAVETVPPNGGGIELKDVASIIFPNGSFSQNQVVVLSKTLSEETQIDFDETAHMFGTDSRAPYEIRVNTGSVAPAEDVSIEVIVSVEYLATIDSGSEFQLFVQIMQASEFDVLDSFELMDSEYNPSTGIIRTTLPVEAFTDLRTLDSTFEAIIVLGTTPTAPGSTQEGMATEGRMAVTGEQLDYDPDYHYSGLRTTRRGAFGAAAEIEETCQGGSLSPPLDNLQSVTSGYNGETHFGTDFGVPNSTLVKSMADGVVERIKTDIRQLQKPDPRSGLLIKGYGLYMVVRHTDGSKSLYAHLENTELSENDSVKAGQVIALSDNSGGSTGPHLHLEYAPNGKIFDKPSKVDPLPCIGELLEGSITVSDGGVAATVADDAFAVFLDEVKLGETALGGANTLAASNLRSGTATLRIQFIEGGGCGSFLAELSDGLTFEGGGISREDCIGLGSSASYAVIIP
tara:strand:- start:1412 stop:3055 length:1644 start_codon:yes stop_codon:yes gene_type:complete